MIILNNKKWLIVIAVILLGIFTIMLIGIPQQTEGDKIGDSIGSVVDSVNDGATELQEEIKDEIDDNTTDRK